MKRTTNEMIEKSINEGYVFLESGTGNCNAKLDEYRAEGYDVRSWYLSLKKADMNWVMYGRMKGQRRKPTPKLIKIDYTVYNTKQLREKCKMYKIKGYGKMNKQQMIDSLKAC